MVSKCGYPRGILSVTFWLVFSTGITTCLPIQTLKEILRNVETDDSLLRADLETLYAFTHKSWNPHVVNNEVSTELERISRDPRYYVLTRAVSDSDQTNVTTTTESDLERNLEVLTKLYNFRIRARNSVSNCDKKNYNLKINVNEAVFRKRKW
ncbi:hypothetical protein L9F63_015960, partial [Diploptera punctata]